MQNYPRCLIIADDLTGAMDSASPFAARGVDCLVMTGVDAECARAAAQVLTVNTESRHLSAQQAAARVREAWRKFGVDRPVLIKKIDSTLRGQVIAETAALLQASGRTHAVVAPAFPAQGRTVTNGVVHVNGVALAHTGFAMDALAPPPLAPLHELFNAVGLRACTAPARGSCEGADIVVPDALTEMDLTQIVDAVRGGLAQALWVGSAGLTRALANAMAQASPRAPRFAERGRLLFVVGSRAAQSAAQVAALRAIDGTRVIDLHPATEVEWPQHAAQLVLRAPQEGGDAEAVARDLARRALQLLETGDASVLIATGGDTALAILVAAGVSALRVMGELTPGIPFAQLEGNGRARWLVTKAGGFGTPDTFVDIARRLRSGAEA